MSLSLHGLDENQQLAVLPEVVSPNLHGWEHSCFLCLNNSSADCYHWSDSRYRRCTYVRHSSFFEVCRVITSSSSHVLFTWPDVKRSWYVGLSTHWHHTWWPSSICHWVFPIIFISSISRWWLSSSGLQWQSRVSAHFWQRHSAHMLSPHHNVPPLGCDDTQLLLSPKFYDRFSNFWPSNRLSS